MTCWWPTAVPARRPLPGGFVALVLACEKLRQDGVLEEMPILNYVAATSAGIVDGQPMLDLEYEEIPGLR